MDVLLHGCMTAWLHVGMACTATRLHGCMASRPAWLHGRHGCMVERLLGRGTGSGTDKRHDGMAGGGQEGSQGA
eukprot:155340-Chlamydomonas_euryale.AAC.3